MISGLELLVIALAGWRLAYLVTNEDGPANVFGWLRRRLGPSEWGAEVKPGSLDKLVSCVYCMSFWTAAAMALAWAVDVKAARDAVIFVAIWGAATALDMVARREANVG